MHGRNAVVEDTAIIEFLSDKERYLLLAPEGDRVAGSLTGHVVEDFAATASHPALCNAILPGRLNSRALRLQTRGQQKCDHVAIQFRIVIQDRITIRTSLGKRVVPPTRWLDDE
jgi:hypothetical protein